MKKKSPTDGKREFKFTACHFFPDWIGRITRSIIRTILVFGKQQLPMIRPQTNNGKSLHVRHVISLLLLLGLGGSGHRGHVVCVLGVVVESALAVGRVVGAEGAHVRFDAVVEVHVVIVQLLVVIVQPAYLALVQVRRINLRLHPCDTFVSKTEKALFNYLILFDHFHHRNNR